MFFATRLAAISKLSFVTRSLMTRKVWTGPRSCCRASPGGSRSTSQLDTVQNATAFLYYTLVLLPVAGAVALWRLRGAAVQTHVLSSPAHLVPLLALAVMLNAGFLSRGSTISGLRTWE